MKYLLVKAWLGFGDRLESLKMAVAFAQQYKLQIYVDWSDEMWSHGDENFYTYFSLNVPSLKSIDEIPEDASVFPKYWQGRLHEKMTRELFDKGKEHSLDIGILDKDFGADVIVFSSIGRRILYQDSTAFASVFRVIDPRIFIKLRGRDLRNTWGIHIRGTDRLRPNKRILSVQSLVSLVVTHGALNGPKMVVVSDDKENAEIWKRFFPQSVLMSDLSLQQNSLAGNHNLSKDSLKTSKDEMNVDMLVDFFTLASCQPIFSTCKDSRFAHEARRLHPFVKTILGNQ